MVLLDQQVLLDLQVLLEQLVLQVLQVLQELLLQFHIHTVQLLGKQLLVVLI